MRRKLLIGILSITVMMLSACGVENEATDDYADTDDGMLVVEEADAGMEESTEAVSSSDTEETETPEENAPTGGYREIYEWIVEKEERDSIVFSLRYLNEDDIPELVIDTGVEAGGCFILTYHDGVLDGWQSGRLNVTYIEKGNLICNSDGKMGYYYDRVYTIQDGKWRYVEGVNMAMDRTEYNLMKMEIILMYMYISGMGKLRV